MYRRKFSTAGSCIWSSPKKRPELQVVPADEMNGWTKKRSEISQENVFWSGPRCRELVLNLLGFNTMFGTVLLGYQPLLVPEPARVCAGPVASSRSFP